MHVFRNKPAAFGLRGTFGQNCFWFEPLKTVGGEESVLQDERETFTEKMEPKEDLKKNGNKEVKETGE